MFTSDISTGIPKFSMFCIANLDCLYVSCNERDPSSSKRSSGEFVCPRKQWKNAEPERVSDFFFGSSSLPPFPAENLLQFPMPAPASLVRFLCDSSRLPTTRKTLLTSPAQKTSFFREPFRGIIGLEDIFLLSGLLTGFWTLWESRNKAIKNKDPQKPKKINKGNTEHLSDFASRMGYEIISSIPKSWAKEAPRRLWLSEDFSCRG